LNTILIIVAIVAIVLLLTGGFVQSLNFLLWVGIVLLVIAVVGVEALIEFLETDPGSH